MMQIGSSVLFLVMITPGFWQQPEETTVIPMAVNSFETELHGMHICSMRIYYTEAGDLWTQQQRQSPESGVYIESFDIRLYAIRPFIKVLPNQ